jgi:peptidoglycan/LPS O-acetylase OafA/YrhL
MATVPITIAEEHGESVREIPTPGPTRTPSSIASGGHVVALDGVRGLAILMVLLLHFVAQTTATTRVEAAVNGVLAYGVLGVDLFFVLSGFLITGILYDARRDEHYFRNFYMRRVLRIFPLYYAVLAVVFLVVPRIGALEGTRIAALREHQGWAWPYGINIYLALRGEWALSYVEHFWSLAVEEHFYFVWPVVVWLLAKRPRALMAVALGTAVLSLAARALAIASGVNAVVTTVLTPFQLDALCLGGLFAVWLRQPGGEERVRRVVAPMALAAGALLVSDFAVHRLFHLEAPALRAIRAGSFRVVLAALLLIALFAPPASPVSRLFRSRAMTVLGKYSYGLYVYHHFLSFYFVSHGTEFALGARVGSHALAVLIQAAVGMAVSLGAAWLSYELFERQFLKLKRYWPSSNRTVALAARTAAAP